MDTDTSEDAGGPAILSGNEVMEAQFKVHDATEKGEPAQKLYLKTFELIDRDILLWQERPESDWPLLATILPNSIVMYPIHANPHTKRYLTPKHGRFKTVIYEDDADGTLPNDPQDVAAHVALRLASNIFDQPGEGLGLIKDLDSVWQALSLIPQADVLVIGKKIRLRLDGRCSSTRTKWIACAGPSTGLKLGDGNSFSIPSTAWYMTRCSQRSPLTGSSGLSAKHRHWCRYEERTQFRPRIASARSGALAFNPYKSRSMCWLPRRLLSY